ncbi:unnamed protein product [Clonostachys chloroleuca]|uniref:MADS-box MEF2 type transcription factor MIG1 n=1 Tax=Clonostachys chloroleuca TaxID=1926264 RepID=A0AA35M4Q6_9HYPO|nr:unnamed protein product [Clonostachys chloroleuca]
MGRRKIEIKAIKDDRNRSVTFLKRKGGLFKKAHELSVLCSVDVAVFVFGNNKKLYEYSSADMRDLITRYQYHGGPNEHKGPSDFNGGNDDDDDEEGDGTPPQPEGLEAHLMPPQYHNQPHFPQIRHHTPSASPPMPQNGTFPGHPHHRGHTPQPSVGSRPGSRNDVRRMGPNMAPPQGGHPGMGYMPTPPLYNNPHGQPGMMPQQQQQPQYPYAPPPPPQQQHQPQHQPPPHQGPQHPPQHQGPSHQVPQPPQQQPQPPQPPVYMEERRSSVPPPPFMSQTPPQPQPMSMPPARAEPSPPQANLAPPQNVPQISTTPPEPERRELLPPPPPPEVKNEPLDRPQMPLLNTDMAIKKLPRKSHSIFTPIEENRSPLSQHLASFASEPAKSESMAAAAAANANRPHSVDVTSAARTSPPQNRARTRTTSVSSATETVFTPPSRSNSFKTGPGSASGARPRGPRLTVQIPGGGSEPNSAVSDSNSPKGATESTSQTSQQQSSHSSGVVLPPPSPSAASALLSAGATGPPNPFARPLPQQNMNAETPASALPSRFLGTEFLPSPSSFYNDWNFRNGDNTLPSPLNFATPVAGSGPSFLREETNFNSSTASTNAPTAGATTATAGAGKRKSIGDEENDHNESHDLTTDAKRVKVN